MKIQRFLCLSLLIAITTPFYAERVTSVTVQDWQKSGQNYNKPVHYLGLGAKLGYSQFNQGMTKSGQAEAGQMENKLHLPGGANAGIDLRYKLEYGLFRFVAGVDATYAGSSMAGTVKYSKQLVEPSPDLTYYYNFTNTREQQHTFEVGVPILFGADYKGFYAMAGMRLGLPVMKEYSISTDLTRTISDKRGIDDYSDMPNHYLYNNDLSQKGKLKLATLNPQVAIEAGYNLDPWLQRKRDRKTGEKPSFVELLHYEVGIYANVGVLDYHQQAKSGEFYVCDEANKIDVTSIKTITDDSQIANKNMVPWNIGVRFNVYYEFYKNPPVKKQRRRRPRPKPVVQDTAKEEVQEVIPTDTIVYNGETIQKGDTIIMENLYFDTDKSTIRSASDRSLNELATLLETHPTMKITLVGHTDNVGKADYNMQLSKARVESVKSELMKRGIDGSRIGTVGKGMTQPIADNRTREGRAENRRVEIIIEEQ